MRVILLADDAALKQGDEQTDDNERRAQAIAHARALLNHSVGHYLSAVRLDTRGFRFDTRGFRFDREEANER